MTKIVGYARVSTDAQDHAAQVAALKAAGATVVIAEKVSGAESNRSGLLRWYAKRTKKADSSAASVIGSLTAGVL